MARNALAERRSKPRFQTVGLLVSVRRKGRLTRLQGTATNFNRHGIAVVVDQPLSKDAVVYLSLRNGDIQLENVVGIVHNCSSQSHGYRCGIQFRPHSQNQFDCDHVEKTLAILEARFAAANRASEKLAAS